MNAARRKQLARAVDVINQAQAIIEEAAEEEREYYENMPESLRGSDKGAAAEEAADALEQASSDLVDLAGTIEGLL